MRRLIVALTLHAATYGPAAAQMPDVHSVRYRVSAWDAASVAAGGVLALIPDAAGLPTGSAPCAPCDPASVPAIDRAALHNASSGANTASSVLLLGVAGFSGLASLDGATAAQVRGHVAVFANSLTWTLATTEWLKVLVHRNRPVLYDAPDPVAAADRDNRRSLPSGHASLAFAAATTYVMIAERERLPHRTRNAILLYAGALGVAALRVAAGQHFPTDVAAGAALGTGLGWLAAHVHPTVP
jgi:membrane-associated phospholipid phosphatase